MKISEVFKEGGSFPEYFEGFPEVPAETLDRLKAVLLREGIDPLQLCVLLYLKVLQLEASNEECMRLAMSGLEAVMKSRIKELELAKQTRPEST